VAFVSEAGKNPLLETVERDTRTRTGKGQEKGVGASLSENLFFRPDGKGKLKSAALAKLFIHPNCMEKRVSSGEQRGRSQNWGTKKGN